MSDNNIYLDENYKNSVHASSPDDDDKFGFFINEKKDPENGDTKNAILDDDTGFFEDSNKFDAYVEFNNTVQNLKLEKIENTDLINDLIRKGTELGDSEILKASLDKLNNFKRFFDIVRQKGLGYLKPYLDTPPDLEIDEENDYLIIPGRKKILEIREFQRRLNNYKNLISVYAYEQISAIKLIEEQIKKCEKVISKIEIRRKITKYRYAIQTSIAVGIALAVPADNKTVFERPASAYVERVDMDFGPQTLPEDLEPENEYAAEKTFLKIAQGKGITQTIEDHLKKKYDPNLLNDFFNQKRILAILDPLIGDKPDAWNEKLPNNVKPTDKFSFDDKGADDALNKFIKSQEQKKHFVVQRERPSFKAKASDLKEKKSLPQKFSDDTIKSEKTDQEQESTQKNAGKFQASEPSIARPKIDDNEYFRSNGTVRIDRAVYYKNLAMAKHAGYEGNFPNSVEYFSNQLLTRNPKFVVLPHYTTQTFVSGVLMDFTKNLYDGNSGIDLSKIDRGRTLQQLRSFQSLLANNKEAQNWLWKQLEFYLEKNQSIGKDGDIVINWTSFQTDILEELISKSCDYLEKFQKNADQKYNSGLFGRVKSFFEKRFV